MFFSITFFVLIIPAQSAFAADIHFDTKAVTDVAEYDSSIVAVIRVDDSLNPVFTTNNQIDTINVTISSQDAFGTPVDSIQQTLTETGLNSGIFTDSTLIFTTNHTKFPTNSDLTVTQDEINDFVPPLLSNCPGMLSSPISSSTKDEICVSIVSTSSPGPAGIGTLTLVETSNSSGHFISKLKLSSSSTVLPNQIKAVAGDILSATYLGGTTNALIAPTSPGTDEILVAPCDGVDVPCDTLTVTYGADQNSINLTPQNGGGGGGGGVILPGFVLDFTASLSSTVGGSPYIVQPPSFGGGYLKYSDGLTITQGTHKTIFDTSKYNQDIPTQVMASGQKVNMTFKTFESYNPNGVIHMGLFIIPRGQDMITPNSLASIHYDKYSPVEVNDPNHILANATVSSTSDGKFQYTQFSFVPKKSYGKMSFLARAWNDHRYSTDVRIHDDVTIPPAPKILPSGVFMFDNFNGLQVALEKDQFYKPQIMAHIHSTKDVFSSDEGGHVYWLYDTVNHCVTLVITDNNDNELSSIKGSLVPYITEQKGDYKFMNFTVQQLNRWDEKQEEKAKKIEEDRALISALEKGIITQSNW